MDNDIIYYYNIFDISELEVLAKEELKKKIRASLNGRVLKVATLQVSIINRYVYI